VQVAELIHHPHLAHRLRAGEQRPQPAPPVDPAHQQRHAGPGRGHHGGQPGMGAGVAPRHRDPGGARGEQQHDTGGDRRHRDRGQPVRPRRDPARRPATRPGPGAAGHRDDQARVRPRHDQPPAQRAVEELAGQQPQRRAGRRRPGRRGAVRVHHHRGREQRAQQQPVRRAWWARRRGRAPRVRRAGGQHQEAQHGRGRDQVLHAYERAHASILRCGCPGTARFRRDRAGTARTGASGRTRGPR
jgi:hypothetical protein